MGRFMTPKEVAQVTGIKIDRIYRLSKKGVFMCLKIGKCLRIVPKSVEHYIKCRDCGIDPPLYKFTRRSLDSIFAGQKG
jgi:excisionase family DNA binding protein